MMNYTFALFFSQNKVVDVNKIENQKKIPTVYNLMTVGMHLKLLYYPRIKKYLLQEFFHLHVMGVKD